MTAVSLGVSTELVAKKIKEANPQTPVTGVKEGIGPTVEPGELEGDVFVNSQGETVAVEKDKITTAWNNAVDAHNEVIPDAKTIKIGGVGSNGKQEQFTLGDSREVSGQKVDTLSTNEQRSALTKAVNTEANNLKELANGDLSRLNDGEVGPKGIKLLDNTEGDLANLDAQRAAMHKRQEEIRKALADNTGVLNAEQRAELEAEQETLNGAMDTIDNVPKTFQTQNGANIKIPSGSNVVSIDQEAINGTDEELEGYEGFFGSDENAPTAAQAYEAFKVEMKAATGQDFVLGDNQNIVMYRDGEEVKFLLVESAMTNGNRETVISKPITASRKDNATTTINTDNIASTKDNQGTVTDASIGGYKFTNNDDQAATSNGSGGEAVTISLVKDGEVSESWLEDLGETPRENISLILDGKYIQGVTKDNPEYTYLTSRPKTFYSFTLNQQQLENLIRISSADMSGLGIDARWLNDAYSDQTLNGQSQEREKSFGNYDVITKRIDAQGNFTYELNLSPEAYERFKKRLS